jgi:hypothetical protein
LLHESERASERRVSGRERGREGERGLVLQKSIEEVHQQQTEDLNERTAK